MKFSIFLSFTLSVVLTCPDDVQAKIYDYVVVGAGAAGLSAAYTLDSQDKNYLVLEKSDRAGGIAENGIKGKFFYAKGTEYLGKPYGALANVIDALKIPIAEIPEPMDATYYKGKMYVNSGNIAKLTAEVAGKKNFEKFIELLNTVNSSSIKTWLELDKITSKQWLDENQIHPFIQHRYDVTSRGLFGANLQDISAASLIPEASFDYEGISSTDELYELSEKSESYTTVEGIAAIGNAIAKALEDNLQYSSAVTDIQKAGDIFTISFEQRGKVSSVQSKKVIVTTAAPIALKIARNVLSDRQKQLLSQIEYAQYVTVALFSDKPIYNASFDLAVLGGGYVTDVYDATWVERYYKPELKNVKEYIASAYLAPMSVSDKSLLQYTDKEIMSIVSKELSPVVPDIDRLITGYEIKRFEYAYPVMNVGYFARLKELKDSFKGLYLAGDYMKYPTYEAAFSSGKHAALRAIHH